MSSRSIRHFVLTVAIRCHKRRHIAIGFGVDCRVDCCVESVPVVGECVANCGMETSGRTHWCLVKTVVNN